MTLKSYQGDGFKFRPSKLVLYNLSMQSHLQVGRIVSAAEGYRHTQLEHLDVDNR